jgi:hypothetical protein
MRKVLQTHLQEPDFFLVHEWCVFEETRLVISRLLREIFYKGVYKQKLYWKGLLIALLEESHEEYLQASLQADSALTRRHEQTASGTPKIKMTARKGRWVISPDSHAHTHCTSRQLGTTANRRYDVPRDCLRKACQMARVCWGTRCEGFCGKEGPHYWIEQSARNQLEHDQVQRVLGKSSRSCRQTSNNQPWFTTWEIPWGFLSWAVLHRLSVGLCHARKCQFDDSMWEEKVWFAIA